MLKTCELHPLGRLDHWKLLEIVTWQIFAYELVFSNEDSDGNFVVAGELAHFVVPFPAFFFSALIFVRWACLESVE